MNRFVLSLCLLPLAGAASGSILFYGGDWDGTNGFLANEINTVVSHALIYDNFRVPSDVPGWRVEGGFLNNLLSRDFEGDSAHMEIREGVSSRDGGRLVFSGDFPAVRRWTGRQAFNMLEYRVDVEGIDLTLAPGEYWLAIAPIGRGAGRAFLSNTDGRGGVGEPLNDYQTYFDSRFFGYDFEPTNSILGAGDYDYSLALTGTVVPEPVTWLVVAMGLGALGRRRRG